MISGAGWQDFSWSYEEEKGNEARHCSKGEGFEEAYGIYSGDADVFLFCRDRAGGAESARAV